MGKPSRDKGARRERQLVQMHTAMGIPAERMPLSGAQKYRGNGADVDVTAIPGADPWECEVKARASGEGFVTLERWLGENDALFLIRDAEAPFQPAPPPLVVLPWARWAELLQALRAKPEGAAE